MQRMQTGFVSKGFLFTVVIVLSAGIGAIRYMIANSYLPPNLAQMTSEAGRASFERTLNIDVERKRAADIKDFESQAKKGNISAQRASARLLLTRRDPRMEAESFKWARQAAAHGNPVAMSELAWYYECGVGTRKNVDEAMRLYLPSAEKGDVLSQYALSRLEKDPRKAKYWQDEVQQALKDCPSCDLPSGTCS